MAAPAPTQTDALPVGAVNKPAFASKIQSFAMGKVQ
jgi:hypothetical protein